MALGGLRRTVTVSTVDRERIAALLTTGISAALRRINGLVAVWAAIARHGVSDLGAVPSRTLRRRSRSRSSSIRERSSPWKSSRSRHSTAIADHRLSSLSMVSSGVTVVSAVVPALNQLAGLLRSFAISRCTQVRLIRHPRRILQTRCTAAPVAAALVTPVHRRSCHLVTRRSARSASA